MNPLDSYLARVARELRPLPQIKRDEELRELRSHLEQRVEDFTRRGLSSEAAQQQTLLEFGSPHTLGKTLCDVWEEGPLSPWRLFSAIGRVSLFWFCTTFELIVAIYSSHIWPESALFPELPYVVALTAFCIPLGCGWLWSNCIGSRRFPLLFLVVFLNTLFWGSVLAYLNSRPFPTAEPFYDSILALNPFFAVGGAYLTRAFRHRPNGLALASGQIIPITFLRSSPWNTRRSYACLALVVGAGVYGHINRRLHPTNSVNTLRASLLVKHKPYDFHYDLEPPTILKLQTLPTTTPAEKAGREARVSFLLEAHANQDTAQWQANYLKTRLAQPGIHSPQLKNRIRQSIATLQHNSHTVQGIARVVRTPSGWKVDESSFDRSQLWSWYYTAISPYSPELAKPQ